MLTDPIADMLTRIRNAGMAGHKTVTIPFSKQKETLADIFLREGYVEDVEILEGDPFKTIKITLKYSPDKQNAIAGLKRISKPGLRTYVGKKDIPRVYNGLGTAIISTSSGVLTDKEARQKGVGGEVICYIW